MFEAQSDGWGAEVGDKMFATRSLMFESQPGIKCLGHSQRKMVGWPPGGGSADEL